MRRAKRNRLRSGRRCRRVPGWGWTSPPKRGRPWWAGNENSAYCARTRASASERSPQLVTLVGVPGIGKSRLLYELWRIVDAEAELIWWRQGRSLPYGGGVSFWALAEMVRAQAGILDSDISGQAGAKLAEMTADVVPGASDADWVRRHLGALVGLGGGGGSVGGDRRGEAFAAWRHFFEALAELRPLVLVFEDLHWADDGLLDFVDY